MAPQGKRDTDLSRFFSDRGIDAFTAADISAIAAPEGRHPRDILPSCRTIIIFGVVMPDRFFFGTEQEQAEVTRELKECLESTALALRHLCVCEGFRAEAVFPSLPLEVKDGKLMGILSLKHCARDAGFGTIGDNSLFIHPEYGNRLALAAVVTEQEIAPPPSPVTLPACTRCNRCVEACPSGAIHDGIVDFIACRNLADYIPRPLIPLVRQAVRGTLSASLMTAFLNTVGSRIQIRPTCTACMTACPYFHKGKR